MIRLVLICLLFCCRIGVASPIVIDDDFAQIKIPTPLLTAASQPNLQPQQVLQSTTFSTEFYQQSTTPNPNHYWHQLTISAQSLSSAKSLVLLSQNHILQHLDVYLFEGDKLIQSKQLGINDRPINTKSYLDEVFRFNIESNSNLTLLISKQTDGPSIVPLKIMTDTAYNLYADQMRLFWGVVIGTFLALAIYNCVVYALNLRNIQYVWYLLFQLFIFLQFAALHGFGYLILPDQFCRWLAKHMGVLHLLLLWSALMFAKHFLEVRTYRPRVYPILEKAKWVLPILIGISLFLSEQQRMMVTSLLILPVSYLCISTAFIALKRGYTPAFSYLLSWVCTFAGATSGLLTYAGLLPVNMITLHSFIIGSLAELYLLSVGLAKRLHHQELLEKQHRLIDHSLDMPNQYFYQHAIDEMFANRGIDKSSVRLILVHTEGIEHLIGLLGNETVFKAKRSLLINLSRDISALPWHIGIEVPLLKRYFAITMPPEQTLIFTDKSTPLQSQFQTLTNIWQRNLANTEYFNDLTIRMASAETDNNGQINELHQKAHMALIEAQARGVKWLEYSHEMSDKTSLRVELLHDLKLAIENDQLELQVQPQMNIAQQSVVGGEALMRWWHPIHGTVSPAVFIPLAEQSGLIHSLTRMALKKMFAWMGRHQFPITLSINISVMDLRQHDFIPFLRSASERYNVRPSQFSLEITESQELESSQEILDKLAMIKQMGFGIALDDFGTGYSSMAYLSKLHIDEVKIDRVFIKDIHHSQINQTIVKTLISMAEALGATTVIEGIESQQELHVVEKLGGKVGQGFYWSPALDIERFEEQYLSRAVVIDKVRAKR
ncbi:MAG: EAL domain-containing protein [Pseudomonadota bacterium]